MFCVFLKTVCEEEGLEKVREEIVTVFCIYVGIE